MNIYFSCSITGGRQDEAIYSALVAHLVKKGHQVPTAHLSSPDAMASEAGLGPSEVFKRDTAWVKGCDVVIAEVSAPSHGVGYEIALACELEKPVLCLYGEGKRVSKMITGNSTPGFMLGPYKTEQEALLLVDRFLEKNAIRRR
jgi:nucleoside 2-deoxyribosyltransferase